MAPLRVPIIRIMSPVSNDSSVLTKLSKVVISKDLFLKVILVITSPSKIWPKAGELEKTLNTLKPYSGSFGALLFGSTSLRFMPSG